MEPKGAQPAQTCPNCGAGAKYRTWESVRGTHGPLHVTSDAHHIVGSVMEALVCKQCGYVQLFVSPQDFYKGEKL